MTCKRALIDTHKLIRERAIAGGLACHVVGIGKLVFINLVTYSNFIKQFLVIRVSLITGYTSSPLKEKTYVKEYQDWTYQGL